ncbi:hypothetical protein FRC11_011301 [Ceratobasidium sp. 423]|nr:hypothetical protein FRC11_011301 [Ceratobasidium sp. 423]
MIENLKVASESLHAALEQYLHTCNGLYTLSSQGYMLSNLSKEDTQQVNTELASILSYEGRVRDARLTMTRARNRLFSFTPINSLPTEVLTHIFEMVVVSQPCILSTCYNKASINRDYAYPDLLMSICSRWRHIVESHPSLWEHIDFVPNRSHAKLMSRAKTYAKRAQTKPLEIHIAGTERAEYNYWNLVNFLESLAGRMKALELFITEQEIGKFYSLVLEKLLPKSNPTTFTRFSLRSGREHKNVFIAPSKYPLYGGHRDPSRLPVDLSPEIIERSLASLEALSLCAVFPAWNSRAYHRLVELRLTSQVELYSQIPERDLVAILKASPKLRVLHFAIDIINQWDGSKLNGPIILNDLEELEVFAAYEFQLEPTLEVGSLLRLLTPGNKSLSLLLQTMDYGPSASWEATKDFLARAKISKFHAKCGCLPINDLLRRMPHLTDLVCYRLESGDSGCGFNEKELRRAIKDAPTVKCPLKSWTMRECTIYLNHLKLMIDLYPTKSLILHNSYVWENEEAMERISDAELPTQFPTVKFMVDRPKVTCPRSDRSLGIDSDSDY